MNAKYKYGTTVKTLTPKIGPQEGLADWAKNIACAAANVPMFQSFLWYNRKLSPQEMDRYNLSFLGEENHSLNERAGKMEVR